MPTTADIKLVVHETRSDNEDDITIVIGWVNNFGCENPNCYAAVCEGRRWHAIPAGHGVTLPDYHFRDADEAITALVGVAG